MFLHLLCSLLLWGGTSRSLSCGRLERMLGNLSICLLTMRLTTALLTTEQGHGSICTPRRRLSFFTEWLKVH